MVKTKVLSVVSNPNERLESAKGFGLVAAIEVAIASFLESVDGVQVGYDLAGTQIDAHSGNAKVPDVVFGRTMVVLQYEAPDKPKAKK